MRVKGEEGAEDRGSNLRPGHARKISAYGEITPRRGISPPDCGNMLRTA